MLILYSCFPCQTADTQLPSQEAVVVEGHNQEYGEG
jgi:hypothetical protein